MGVKIADKLEQYNNGTYYLVDSSAVEYVDKDGVTKSVKEVLDSTPTDVSTHKTTIYENHIDMGKYLLLAKITGANYSNNIIKFSCPNYKGSMDVGFKYEDDMDIYKFELHFNTGSRRENNSYGVTLKQHGLGLYAYPQDNPKNTEPRLEEAIRLYWDYSKGDIYVFLVDIMTAIPHCVLEYTGSGTLLRENTFVTDDLYNRREGLNGTWEESKWKSIPYNKLETPPIHELGGGSGSAEGAKTYTTIEDLGLTADATIQDVIDKLPIGGTALLRTDAFTNWSTLFNGIQWGYFKVEKTVNGLSNIELQEVVTPNRRYFGTQSSGKFSRWILTSSKVTAAFNSKTFKIDITKGNENWNGNMKFGYCVDESYGEIIISSLGKTEVVWGHSTGVRYVKSVTYTIDPDNNAHVTIGVELYDIVYGIHLLETTGDFATINSFTGDAFTGTSVALRRGVRGRNNGVGILSNVEDLGLTSPCTTVQIAQAMKKLTNGGNRIPKNGMIGIFDCEGKASTITDAPADYGLLHIETYGYDRILIRFDGVASSSYTGSWIGQIKGSSGTFSSITWTRIDNETRVTTLETQVSELFQSVSNGKSLVANAITGKGVSTSSTATFATMATNISKIKGYKEETKSFPVPLSGTTTITTTFSADVLGIKQIILPTDTSRLIPQETGELFKIEGKKVTTTITGVGTWKITALIQA